MKVFIDSYNNVMQHGGGGVPMRIRKFQTYFSKLGIQSSLFNKWKDNLSDCDILHIFKANLDSYAQIVFAKKLGKTVVISSVVPQENANIIRLALFLNKLFRVQNTYSLLKQSFILSDAIIAQTQKEKEFIKRVYRIAGDKIYVIPNGVNESILSTYDLDNKKDIILCVGRFDRNKNQLSLIKSLSGTDYECHFVGGKAIDEPDYYDLCLAEASHNNNIHFHGWLEANSEEFLTLYKRAKVVALVSHHEIFGNSLIEGGACGANLVATKVLPTEEWGFGDTCVKVDCSNLKELRRGIKAAFDKPVNKDIHNIVVKKFSWENIAQKHIELYRTLLR